LLPVSLLPFFLFLFLCYRKDVEVSQNRDNIQSVEIYNFEKAYYEGNIHTFLEENEPVAVLEEERFTAFLDALCNLEFEEEKVFSPISMDGGYDYEGYIIAVVYSCGGYDISNCCGETLWTEFVEKYIEN